MRRYNVQITDEALADMEQLYNYIAYVLLSPENAMGQYNRIVDLRNRKNLLCYNRKQEM